MENEDPKQSALRGTVLKLLGGPWPAPVDLKPHTEESLDRADHVAHLVSYEVEEGERVKAWLLIPKTPKKSNPESAGFPGIAVWHQHNDEYHLGKSESAGLAGNPMHHTAPQLAAKGYVVLCPDALGFEDRRSDSLEGAAYERHMAMHYLSTGKSLAWKNILDCRRALDFLSSRPELDESRLGCYGHSLGSTFTWLTGPWDERLKCMVGNCCMPSQAAMDGTSINHSFSNYIPGLSRIGDLPKYVSLIAPRRLHLNFGAKDKLNPVEYIEAETPIISAAFEAAGAAENFSFFIDRAAGHELSEDMKSRMFKVFSETL